MITSGMKKHILGVMKNATSVAVLAELGWYPIVITIALNIVKAWPRIHSFTNLMAIDGNEAQYFIEIVRCSNILDTIEFGNFLDCVIIDWGGL